MKKVWSVCCKVISLLLNLLLVYMETIAAPMSWEGVGMQMFTFYTELSNLFSTAVCALVALAQLVCIFTGRDLPLWIKRLKFVATCCLTMTLLTVVFILAPYYEDGNGWYIMLFTGSMLYHHFLNPIVAFLSYVLFERRPLLRGRDVFLAWIPTLLYGGVTVWANIVGKLDGPYPFLRVYENGLQMSIVWAVAVLGSNLIYAWLLWKLGGGSGKRRGKATGFEIRG